MYPTALSDFGQVATTPFYTMKRLERWAHRVPPARTYWGLWMSPLGLTPAFNFFEFPQALFRVKMMTQGFCPE